MDAHVGKKPHSGKNIEKEFTITIGISEQSYNCLWQELFQGQSNCRTYCKQTFSNNKRILSDANGILYQYKKTLKVTKHMCMIDGFILNIHEKIAIEKTVEYFCSDLCDRFSYLKRHYFFHRQTRFSIDRSVDEGQEKVFFLNVELENCDALTKFEFELKQYKQLNRMLSIVFSNNHPFYNILNREYKIERPFTYLKGMRHDDKVILYAPKLDGQKYMCVIMPKRIVVPELTLDKKIEESQFKQFIIGTIELIDINDTKSIYVTDILYVLNDTGIFCHIDSLMAAQILATNKIVGENIATNSFVTSLETVMAMIKTTPMLYDGYLEFYEDSIRKMKNEATIDLIIFCSKIIKPKENLAKLFKFNDGITTVSQLDYEIDNNNFPIAAIQKNFRRQFYIVEFKIDFNRKKLHFLRIRDDKAVANTIGVFNQMKIQNKKNE